MAIIDVPAPRAARISSTARELQLGRLMLTALAAVLYGAGWSVAQVVTGVLYSITWCIAAVRVGWDDARAGRTADGTP